MGGRPIERVLAARIEPGVSPGRRPGRQPEEVLVEEPLELRVDGVLVATTMRTPGHDFELAAGWALAEGLLGPVESAAPITDIRYCATGSAVDTGFNTVSVTTSGAGPVGTPRLGTVSSSCGVCGAEAVSALVDRLPPLPADSTVRSGTLLGGTAAVSGRQDLFAATGGSHAAAMLDVDGQVIVLREDIGRHNAADKAVGHLLLDGRLPVVGSTMWISGRASFEMVQKAWSARCAALVSVSAPSALAIATAERAGLVLAGFSRSGRTTVYAGLDRVVG
ncbi:MAG: formate dehydrogenase accessory sulfurtransferase FdhD [Actinomycetota bacterium]